MFFRRCRFDSLSGAGFSLLEVMVVLVIIGLLAGLVTMNVRSRMTLAKQNAAKSEIATVAEAVEMFYTVHGRYPTSDEGLPALAQPSEAMPEPLLETVPKDPWGRSYVYNCPGLQHPYEVMTLGADGREGGEGADADITNWQLKEKA